LNGYFSLFVCLFYIILSFISYLLSIVINLRQRILNLGKIQLNVIVTGAGGASSLKSDPDPLVWLAASTFNLSLQLFYTALCSIVSFSPDLQS